MSAEPGAEPRALWRALCEAVPEHLSVLDAELRYVWVNRAFSGLEPDGELIGRSLAEYVTPETFERARECADEVLRTGNRGTYMASRTAVDGETWHQVWMHPVPERSDRLLLVSRDVTHERRLEDELRDSRSWEHQLVTQFPGVVLLLEADGVIVVVNEIAARSLGSTPAHLEGQNVFEHMPPEVLDKRRWWFETVLETGKPLSGIERDGDRFHNTTVFVVQQGADRPPRIGIVSRDVTEEQRAQELLRERERRQIRSEKMEALGTLAAGIAHDFNNLLTPIVMNARLAARPSSTATSRAKQLSDIESAALRAAALVRQILAYSQHRMEEEARPLKLEIVVAEVVELARSTVGPSVSVRSNIADRDIWVVGVAERLQQALINLIINANQAMGPSGGELVIELDVDDTGGGDTGVATVRVRDTGPGIEPAQMSRIFEPFFSTKGPNEGSGLGLYVVHRIAKNHGGEISVDSEVGRGATFSLSLPLLDLGADSDRGDEREQPDPPPLLELLLVDDDARVGRACESWLRAEGQQVHLASTVSDAVAAFTATPERFDAAVLDFRLRAGSGVELAYELWKHRPSLPIVLYSGYLTDEAREALADRPVAFLPKPFKPSALLDTITRLVAAGHR